MDNKTVDVTTAILHEREQIVQAINDSGLPATVSAMVVKEILEVVQQAAAREYEAAQRKEAGDGTD